MNSTDIKCSNTDFLYFGVGHIKTMSMQKPEPMDTKRCLFFSYHRDVTKPERDENYVCSSDITETMTNTWNATRDTILGWTHGLNELNLH